jgi:hypothetical protein
MSDFQMGLLAIGAAIVVLVLAYNKWQERRLKQQGNAAFGSRHDDVLLDGPVLPATVVERIEPVLADLPLPGTAVPPEGTAAATGTSSDVPGAPREPQAATSVIGTLPLDGRIDWVVVLNSPAGENLDPAPLLGADWSAFTRALTLLGEAGGEWRALEGSMPCERMLVALQLADRRGPVPGMELAALATLLRELAAANGWQVSADSMETVAQRAADLDKLCAEVDVRILFEVVAAGDKPFLGTRIRALAEANGLTLADGETFVRADDAGARLFTLKNRGATPFSPEHMREFSTRALTLTLDVPRAPRSAYQAMRNFALTLCDALQGSIVDEQGRKLDTAAMDRVAAQLAAIDARLARLGVIPGGAMALRLFS